MSVPCILISLLYIENEDCKRLFWMFFFSMFLSRLSFETVEIKQDKNSDEESSSDDDDSSSDDENEVKIELDVSCTI